MRNRDGRNRPPSKASGRTQSRTASRRGRFRRRFPLRCRSASTTRAPIPRRTKRFLPSARYAPALAPGISKNPIFGPRMRSRVSTCWTRLPGSLKSKRPRASTSRRSKRFKRRFRPWKARCVEVAKAMQFEKAAELRDRIKRLKILGYRTLASTHPSHRRGARSIFNFYLGGTAFHDLRWGPGNSNAPRTAACDHVTFHGYGNRCEFLRGDRSQYNSD